MVRNPGKTGEYPEEIIEKPQIRLAGKIKRYYLALILTRR